MIPVRTMKHIPQMREIPHLNPQRLGNLHGTIASLDKSREMAVNGSEGYTYLHSHSQALLAENLELSRRLQTLKSLTESSAMESRDSSPNDQSYSSYTLKFLN
ncbi:MAG: gas vesicle protein [Microcystis aeruginosa W13-11]|nr:gas vesicle protein [Microcystis aeruginosa W13-11]